MALLAHSNLARGISTLWFPRTLTTPHRQLGQWDGSIPTQGFDRTAPTKTRRNNLSTTALARMQRSTVVRIENHTVGCCCCSKCLPPNSAEQGVNKELTTRGPSLTRALTPTLRIRHSRDNRCNTFGLQSLAARDWAQWNTELRIVSWPSGCLEMSNCRRLDCGWLDIIYLVLGDRAINNQRQRLCLLTGSRSVSRLSFHRQCSRYLQPRLLKTDTASHTYGDNSVS